MGNNLRSCGEDDFADCDAASIAHSAVDPELRVRGTSNVFVADASVMPKVPNGNVHSSVTMVAYRAADLLTGEEGGKKFR
jgi:choline dehydrogenase